MGAGTVRRRRGVPPTARLIAAMAVMLLAVHWLLGSAAETTVVVSTVTNGPTAPRFQTPAAAADAAVAAVEPMAADPSAGPPVARSRFEKVEWAQEYRALIAFLQQRYERGTREASAGRYLFPLLRYGPNNQFLCLMQAVKLAKDTKRTLVLPKLQAWQNDRATKQLVWPFDSVFDAEALSKVVATSDIDDFVAAVGGKLGVLVLPKLDYMKYDRQRTLESLRNNGLEVGGGTLELDNEHMSGDELRQLLRHELSSVAAVALAPMPHVKGVLYPHTVPQVAFDADFALLRAVRFAPRVREIAAALQQSIAVQLHPQGAAKAVEVPRYLGVHIRRKGQAIKLDKGQQRDDGSRAAGPVMLGVVDKDIYFEPDQVSFALKRFSKAHGLGVVYLATNRASDVPKYNVSGARLFSFSEPAQMTQQLAPWLRQHGHPLGADGAPEPLDNFVVSMVEQELCRGATWFLGSVRSTWTDNVMWWRSGDREKRNKSMGIVEAIYTAYDLQQLFHGQLYDERKLARDNVMVHKGGRNW